MRTMASGGEAVLVVVGVRLGMRVNQGLGPGVGVGEFVGEGVIVKVAYGVFVGGMGVSVFTMYLMTGVSEIFSPISSVVICTVAEDVAVGATSVSAGTRVAGTCVTDDISCVCSSLVQPTTTRESRKHEKHWKINDCFCLERFSNCSLPDLERL
jgi:hypothetical protein